MHECLDGLQMAFKGLGNQLYTVNGETFAGLNFRGFDPMKYFAEILSRFIGQECSQL